MSGVLPLKNRQFCRDDPCVKNESAVSEKIVDSESQQKGQQRECRIAYSDFSIVGARLQTGTSVSFSKYKQKKTDRQVKFWSHSRFRQAERKSALRIQVGPMMVLLLEFEGLPQCGNPFGSLLRKLHAWIQVWPLAATAAAQGIGGVRSSHGATRRGRSAKARSPAKPGFLRSKKCAHITLLITQIAKPIASIVHY
jgi:hypothetical protein